MRLERENYRQLRHQILNRDGWRVPVLRYDVGTLKSTTKPFAACREKIQRRT
jgi:hypothetical protein